MKKIIILSFFLIGKAYAEEKVIYSSKVYYPKEETRYFTSERQAWLFGFEAAYGGKTYYSHVDKVDKPFRPIFKPTAEVLQHTGGFYASYDLETYCFVNSEFGEYGNVHMSCGEVGKIVKKCEVKSGSIYEYSFFTKDEKLLPKKICHQNCEAEFIEVIPKDDSGVVLGPICSFHDGQFDCGFYNNNIAVNYTGKVCTDEEVIEYQEPPPEDIPDENRLKPCPKNEGSYSKSLSECEAFPPKKDPEQPVPPKEPENPEQPPQTPPETPPETTDEGDKDNPAGGGKRPDNGNNAGTPNNDGNPDGKGSGTHSGQNGQNGQNGGDTGNNKGEEEGGEEGEDEGNSIGGGNCKTREPPKCKGDAALCYIGQEQWRHRCLVEQAEEQRQALDDYGKSNAGYLEGELRGVGDLSATVLNDAAEYINIPTGLDTYGFGWSRTCPIIPDIEGGRYGKYKFRSDIFCNLANILGNLLVLVCLVLSAKYVFKGD